MSDRQELIDGLRAFATFLEEHPEVPTPIGACFDVFVKTKEQVAALARIVGGRLAKETTENWFFLRRHFGPIQYDINCARDLVCERVVTGTRTVAAVTLAAKEAVNIPEHEEDVWEWKCGEILP
jgi:hypothetical protein